MTIKSYNGLTVTGMTVKNNNELADWTGTTNNLYNDTSKKVT